MSAAPVDAAPPITRVLQLPPPPEGWSDYGYVALSDGTFAALHIDRDFQGLDPPQMFRAWRNAHLRISRVGGDDPGAITIKTPPFPLVDRLPDGHWVVISGRTFDGDSNGYVFDADGGLVRRFPAGDAVMNLSTSADARIWIGYFDEGVFGRDPLSQNGIVALDPEGRPIWAYPQSEDDLIADCYALTTSGTRAWACPYQGFPIVRIDDDGGVRRWNNTCVGAKAISVSGDHVILAGGYQDDFNLMRLLRLGDEDATLVAEARLPAVTREGGYFQGRAGAMFAFTGREVAEIAVADWVAASSGAAPPPLPPSPP